MFLRSVRPGHGYVAFVRWLGITDGLGGLDLDCSPRAGSGVDLSPHRDRDPTGDADTIPTFEDRKLWHMTRHLRDRPLIELREF